MDIDIDPSSSQLQNVGYWCIVRDEDTNIVYNGNNFVIQNAHTNEIRFVEDTVENRQCLQLTDLTIVNEPTPVILDTKKDENVTKDDNLFWSKIKVKTLLSLTLSANVKDEHFWNEISSIIGASPEECSLKYRNLRRTYVRLLRKKRQGKNIKWVHFNSCEELFGDNKLNSSNLALWEDEKIQQLLTLYIEKLSSFQDPNSIKKDVWIEIAHSIGTTYYSCYHKFKNLKRTYLSLLNKCKRTGKLLKWPYHQYFERIFSNYNPKVKQWDRAKIKLLLNMYSKLFTKFKNRKYQKKELWKRIAIVVQDSPLSCDRKFRNLKQTYIKMKTRIESGGFVKWRYYSDFENIYKDESIIDEKTGYATVKSSALNTNYREDDCVKDLLNFYIKNVDKFQDPKVKKNLLWKQIAPRVGMTSYECDRKFRNLKQTYVRLKDKPNKTETQHRWPYFDYFEQIYNKHSTWNNSNHIHSLPDCQEENDITYNVEDLKFDRLVKAIDESNEIQRERNQILLLLLQSRK